MDGFGVTSVERDTVQIHRYWNRSVTCKIVKYITLICWFLCFLWIVNVKIWYFCKCRKSGSSLRFVASQQARLLERFRLSTDNALNCEDSKAIARTPIGGFVATNIHLIPNLLLEVQEAQSSNLVEIALSNPELLTNSLWLPRYLVSLQKLLMFNLLSSRCYA